MFAMFGATANGDDSDDDAKGSAEQGKTRQESAEADALGLGIDLWGAASAAAKTFQQTAADVVKTVGETNWQNELSTFSQGVSEDTHEISHKTAEFVEHLPDRLTPMASPTKQADREQRTSSGGGVSAVADVAALATQFGHKLFQGATQIIDQVREDIDEEISEATREGKRAAKASSKAAAGSAAPSTKAAAPEAPTPAPGKALPAPPAGGVTEKQLVAMQRDSNTYLDEPEDEDDFNEWHAAFSLSTAQADIDALLGSNAFMAELHSRIVPGIVENEEFWTRYFYRLYKLQQECSGSAAEASAGPGGALGAAAGAAATVAASAADGREPAQVGGSSAQEQEPAEPAGSPAVAAPEDKPTQSPAQDKAEPPTAVPRPEDRGDADGVSVALPESAEPATSSQGDGAPEQLPLAGEATISMNDDEQATEGAGAANESSPKGGPAVAAEYDSDDLDWGND